MTTTPMTGADACATNDPAPADAVVDRSRCSYLVSSHKRALDLVIAAASLLLALPLLLVLALLVRLDSPGPAFYRQVRVGRNRRRSCPRRARAVRAHLGPERRRCPGEGQPFEIVKLRTMVVDAERNGPQLELEDDPRVTRCGRWLRLTHLDELPQLWNVLRGDMSLVGPRPERPFFVDRHVLELHGFRARLAVRPGITGLAQLENGYDRSPADVVRKLKLDVRYLRTASLVTDLRLLARTVPHLLPRRRHP